MANGVWNLAALVVQLDCAEGARLWRQALATYERALGADHPTTAQCRAWGAAL